MPTARPILPILQAPICWPSEIKPSTESPRLGQLDTIKGMLVVLMLVFHNASIALAAHPGLVGITGRLEFLHTAFLIITGFLCGAHYAGGNASPEQVRKRLLTRALRLLGLFACLNLVLLVASDRRSANLLATLNTSDAIFQHCLRHMNGQLMSFVVLFYIAVYLMLASFTFGSNRNLRFGVVFAVCLAGAPWSHSLRFAAFGMLGMGLGLVSRASYVQRAYRAAAKNFWLPASLLLAWHAVSPAVSGKEEPSFVGFNLRVLCETTLWFWTAIAAFSFRPCQPLVDRLKFLGPYTLLAYLAQMGIIELNYALWARHLRGTYTYYALSFLASSGLLLFLISWFDRLKAKSRTITVSYQLILG